MRVHNDMVGSNQLWSSQENVEASKVANLASTFFRGWFVKIQGSTPSNVVLEKLMDRTGRTCCPWRVLDQHCCSMDSSDWNGMGSYQPAFAQQVFFTACTNEELSIRVLVTDSVFMLWIEHPLSDLHGVPLPSELALVLLIQGYHFPQWMCQLSLR